MATYGYSAGYQGGGPSSVPSGYIEAYSQAGRNIGAGIQSIGSAIGSALQRYGEKKAENEFLTQRLESLAPYLQTVAQSGNIMDERTPESKLLGDIEKFSSMSIPQKKATLLNAEFYLDRLDKQKAKEITDAAARQQLRLGELQLEDILGKREQQGIITKAIRYATEQPQTKSVTDQVQTPVSVQYQPEGPFSIAPQALPETRPERFYQEQMPAFRPLQQPQFMQPQGLPSTRPTPSIPQTWESVLGAEFANRIGTPVQTDLFKPTTKESQGLATFETTKETPVTSEQRIPYEQQSSKLTRFLIEQGAKPETIAMVPQILEMVGQRRPTTIEQVGGIGSVVRFGDKEQFVPAKEANLDNILKVRGLTVDFPEFKGTAPTEAEAAKFRDQYSNVLESRQAISDLLEIAKMGTAMQQTPEVKAKANSLAAGLRGVERINIIGPGTITPEDFKLLESVIPNPTAIFSLKKSNIQAFETMLQKSARAIESKAKAIGLQVVNPKQQPVAGPSGSFLKWNPVSQKLE
jgi:hypothetical protein